MTREKLQLDAKIKWYNSNCKGTVAYATGTGKSKIAVDIVSENKDWKNVYLIVPTEKLRDENWKEEFKKWKHLSDYSKIKRLCYASIDKVEDSEEIDLVIADEFHNITEHNSSFFKKNKVKRILALTATPPDDKIKLEIFNKYAPVIATYTIDQGVKDGIIAPYEITVIECRLDDKEKYVKAGTKEKPFYTTEQKHYEYLSKSILMLQYSKKKEVAKWKILERMRFIYNLRSKTELAKKLKDKFLKDKKSLIFCGSINQAEELSPYTFHSKTSDKNLNKLIKGSINELASVECLNEGVNIPSMEAALIVQLNSKEKDAIQRIGRLLRFREGHLAKIYILVVTNTVDENWAKKALQGFSNITYVNYKNI